MSDSNQRWCNFLIFSASLGYCFDNMSLALAIASGLVFIFTLPSIK